jgi:hypothetical protein
MKKAPKQLLLHGKPFDPAYCGVSSDTVSRWLDSQTGTDLFDSGDVRRATKIADRTLCQASIALQSEGYATKIGRIYYYGNRAAIAELKRRLTN